MLSFGGFLGMGSRHFPLPWEMLRYNTSLGGYVVKLEKAPVVEKGWADRRRTIDDPWATPLA